MRSADDRTGVAGRATSVLAGIASILVLMWPALVNGGPFYFSDTSSYVRAGDVAARMVFGPGARTIWTRESDSGSAVSPSTPAGSPPAASAATGQAGLVQARGNEPERGYIMSGRSPFFGVILWLSWVASRFWLFILVQAVCAYVLIVLGLRAFGYDRPGVRLGVAAALSVLTPLAIYDGVLLADGLSGFGIAAFLLLGSPTARLSRLETIFLILLLIVSIISHLTHLVMVASMTAVLAFCLWRGWVDRVAARRGIAVGVATTLIGVVSVMATSFTVERHYGRPPVLVPLITARFVADGPGRDFIASGCGGRDFAVCKIRQNGWTSSTDFLWSRDRAIGGFLTESVETRRLMSEQDKAFALAVAKAYPIRTALFAVWNTLLQIGDVRSQILTGRCFARPACVGDQFPPEIVQTTARTLSGQGLWPMRAANVVIYAAAVGAIAVLAVLLPGLRRRDPAMARQLALWVALVVVAMLVNGFLGGAISEPQSRYQARMAWLIPFLAALALLRWRAIRRPA